MAKRKVLMLCVLLAVIGILVPRLASAADSYEVVAEYDGTYFHVVNAPTYNQLIENPTTEFPFINPGGVAVSIAPDGRIMNYVLDSGNKRILGYETNMDVIHDSGFTWDAVAVDAANEYDDDELALDEWVGGGGATKWVVPYSLQVKIDGTLWTYEASIAGKAAADQVFTITWNATTGPIITFPSNSLSATSVIELVYAISDYNGGGTGVYGLGQIDQGNRNDAVTSVVTEISETAPAATSFQDLTEIFRIVNETNASTDELWVLDSNDDSTGQDEFLQVYTVTRVGVEALLEQYDDAVSNPSDVYVAAGPTAIAAAQGGCATHTEAIAVSDENQVTGHSYSLAMTGSNVTITDLTTERVLVDSGAKADFVNGTTTCNIFPGLLIDFKEDIADDAPTVTFTTTRAVPERYGFIADTGNNRIKVLAVGDIATTTGDDIPGDPHLCIAQPTGAGTIGVTADSDFRFTTPAAPGSNWRTGTLARPLKEGSVVLIEDPAGATPITWTPVADISTAGPTDTYYQVDWWEGQIIFGDGVHGKIPTASTLHSLVYTTTPDCMRYGSIGSGPGQFSSPEGVCAVWDANNASFNVYVCDTGNNRLQKFRFTPEITTLGLPYNMEYVCEWNTGLSTSDYLNGPTDIDVASDGTDTFISVVDYGNNRVLIYKDSHVDDMTATAPVFETVIGGTGNTLGQYNTISSVELLVNGTELEVYISDASRGVITKYVKAPSPTITLVYTGTSLLPKSFPPTSSYPWRFTTTNAPSNGWVDLYYSTEATFDATSAVLCFTSGTVLSTSSPASWTFASTPTGTPADGDYYVHAILRDGSGTLLASSSGGATHLLTIDSNLVPAVQAVDAFDSFEARGHSDRVLLMGPTASQTIYLQLSYPDSVTSVTFDGTFPANMMTIESIIPVGNAWDGSEGNQVVNMPPTIDNVNGTFNASSSVLDSPIGLTHAGNRNMFIMQVTPKDILTSSSRVFSGTMAMSTTTSSITTIHDTQLGGWIVRDLAIKLAYVGDIATTNGGLPGTKPYLEPNPDGLMDFDDLVVFGAGWNGTSLYRDKIADMDVLVGGAAPALVPYRDGDWDVDDIQALTTNWSWFSANPIAAPAPAAFSGEDVLSFSPLGLPVEGETSIELDVDLGIPLPGHQVKVDVRVNDAVDMTAALVRMAYDPGELELIAVDSGEMLRRGDGEVLMFTNQTEGLCELNMGRLIRGNEGVYGDGVIATLTFEITGDVQSGLGYGYDLRAGDNSVLLRGTNSLGNFGAALIDRVMLCQNFPNPLNPMTKIVFALPNRSKVDLGIFDLTGRRVATLVSGMQDAGIHTLDWNGMDRTGNEMPSGVYFYKLKAGSDVQTRKLVITR